MGNGCARNCARAKISKRSESQKRRFAKGAETSGEPAKDANRKREGGAIDVDDDDDDEEIKAAKLRIAKAAKRLEVLPW